MSDNPFDLTGKVAIVTGASRGLGQEFGRALAEAGADLVVTSRDAAALTDFESEIEVLGRRVVSLEFDVREQDSIERMADAAFEAFREIHILVTTQAAMFANRRWMSLGTIGIWCWIPTCAARFLLPRRLLVVCCLAGTVALSILDR